MRERRFGMYLPIVFLVLMEVIVILQNGKGVNASAVQRWSKRNSADVVKLDPLSTESTDIRINDPGGLRETEVPEESIFLDIVERVSAILCAFFRVIFRQSYRFMSADKRIWIEDISNLLNLFEPSKPEPESAEPSENLLSPLISVLDYINPFKPDTSQKEPPPSADDQINFIQSALDYLNPFKSAANQQQDRQLGNGRFNLDPSVVDFSNLAMPLFDVPRHFQPDEDFEEFVRLTVEFLRDITTAILSIDLAQYLRPYINSLEDCILEINPFGLLNRLEPVRRANGETGELNMHVSDPAIDPRKPHKTVRNSVHPSLRTVHLSRHDSLGATNSLTSNPGTAIYLHRLRSNYLRRRSPPTN